MREKNSVARSAVLVTLMMFVFKMLGFVKQAVIAYVYGTTVETDTYFIAWGFISGISEAIVKALLVSLVAVYTSIRVREGKKQAAKLINGLFEILLPIFILLTLIVFFAAPFFSRVLAPSYQGEDIVRLSGYIKTLAPVLLFGCFELIYGAISDSYKSFFVPRLQSLIYSVSVIIACILLSSILGVKALVCAQYFSSTVFILLLFVSTKKYHEYFWAKYNEIPELKAIIYTAVPLFIGNSALQINQIVDKSITSGLGEGVASALSYCHTLEQFVTNVMIVNIGNVMFANFAEFVAEERFEEVKAVLSKALNLLIVLLLGISVITIVCSKDIVTIVYYRGNFTKEAVTLTAIALVGYAISFAAVAVRDLSIKSLYAFKETKSPMIASIISICVNITLSLLLSRYIGILGVSLATSISAIVGMIIISFALKKKLLGYRYSKHFFVFVKCIPGMIVLFAFCCFVEKIILFNALIRFLIASVVGLFIYLSVLALLKVEGVDEIYALAKSKVGMLIRRR